MVSKNKLNARRQAVGSSKVFHKHAGNYFNPKIGIQPKSLKVGNNLSKEVKIAVKYITDAVLGAIYTDDRRRQTQMTTDKK